tara:strand:- start:65 stop:1447 length:1383 start_codon:yes stop_codon:yes gene_type:complete
MNTNKNLQIKETFNLAIKNHQEDKTDIAQELYNQVLKINPNHSPALNNLGVIFKELGENQKAKKCYEKAITINPNHVGAHNNLGVIFKELEEHQKAKDCFEKVITIDPNHIDALNNLGAVLQDLGEHQKAKDFFEKVITIDPNYVNAYSNLGAMFQDLGEYQKAEDYYKKAIALKPDHEISLYNLGVVLYSTKQYQNAIEKLELINFKNSKSVLLNCLYELNDKDNFFKKLNHMIKQGESNSTIGSLISRSEIKFGIKKFNPFCEDPLKYTFKTSLTEQYDFKNIFVEPIKNILNEETFFPRHQGLLKNGHQTAGNLFTKKNDFLDRIKDIIHLEVEKYQDHFKKSNEGLILSWPKSYSISAWLVSMKSGGKLDPHMHDNGWISGSIYINVPPKSKSDSGNLVVCIDNQNPEAEKNINPKKIMDVVTGSLCLFPSSLYHYTIPFESDEKRIILAFDVKPN